jgi:hypothetical protein
MEEVFEKVKEFLEQPAINKRGFFLEIGMKREAWDQVVRGRFKFTPKMYSRMLPQLLKYGYRE